MRRALLLLCCVVLAGGCAITSRSARPDAVAMRGAASWYGQEFAGRTTANGEIFDPFLLTAAHRSLPFGTVLLVKNVKSGASVEVRINDRGPFVGDRIIDLSWAAAQKIGLIEDGIGSVELAIVRVGRGDREPPAPYVVTIPRPAEPELDPAIPPPIAFPLPGAVKATPPGTETQSGDFGVSLAEEREGIPVRKQVSRSGKTLEEVPLVGGAAGPVPPSPVKITPPPVSRPKGFVIQAGAFQIEQNARDLRQKVAAVIPTAYVDRSDTLFRVRAGPFATRQAAIEAREVLEAAGLSAIILAE